MMAGVYFTQEMLTDTNQFILFLFIIIILWLINHKMNYMSSRIDNLENRIIKDLRESILKDLNRITDYDMYKEYIYDKENEK